MGCAVITVQPFLNEVMFRSVLLGECCLSGMCSLSVCTISIWLLLPIRSLDASHSFDGYVQGCFHFVLPFLSLQMSSMFGLNMLI